MRTGFRDPRRGALPSTLVGAETCIVIGVVGLRLIDLGQLGASLAEGVAHATNRAADAAFLVAYGVESILFLVATVRRRRVGPLPWVLLDFAVGVAVLIGQPVFTAAPDRIGTWIAWGFGVSIGTALVVAVGFPTWPQSLAAGATLTVAYLVVSVPAALDTGEQLATVIANSLAYLGFVVSARALAQYLRRLACTADEARRRAQVLGAQLEWERQKPMLHDQQQILQLLSRPQSDAQLASALRHQAGESANRLGQHLTRRPTGETSPTGTSPVDLRQLLENSADEFSDLSVTVSALGAVGVLLDADTAEAVGDAVRTLLMNVRVHAHASRVVIHAAGGSGTWELTIADDGTGFDRDTTRTGTGITVVLHRNLRALGLTTALLTSPGHGTTAVIASGHAAHRG